MAVVLSPHTRMVKLATDVKHGHAHNLIQSELAKMIELDRIGYNLWNERATTASNSASSDKRFKSYTSYFKNDTNHGELRKNMGSSICAHRESKMYL